LQNYICHLWFYYRFNSYYIYDISICSLIFAPLIPKDYTKKVKTGGEIEAKYLAMGPFETNSFDEEIHDY